MNNVMHPLTNTSDEMLDAILKNHDQVVAHFWAPWNAWDQAAAEAINEAVKEFSNVMYVAINIDQNGQHAKNASIYSIPAFVLWSKGSVMEKWMPGNVSKGAHLTKLREWHEKLK